MEERPSWLEILLDKGIEFIKTGIELLKLKAIDRISEAVSSVAAWIIAGVILFSGLIIGSVGVAFWLGELLGKTWYGFFIVAGVYFISGLITLAVFKKRIKLRVSKWLNNKVVN